MGWKWWGLATLFVIGMGVLLFVAITRQDDFVSNWIPLALLLFSGWLGDRVHRLEHDVAYLKLKSERLEDAIRAQSKV